MELWSISLHVPQMIKRCPLSDLHMPSDFSKAAQKCIGRASERQWENVLTTCTYGLLAMKQESAFLWEHAGFRLGVREWYNCLPATTYLPQLEVREPAASCAFQSQQMPQLLTLACTTRHMRICSIWAHPPALGLYVENITVLPSLRDISAIPYLSSQCP